MSRERWRDWYEQSKRDRQKAMVDIEHGFHDWACFTLQQAAEKSLKALGLKLGIELWGHSINELTAVLSETLPVPDSLKECAKILDFFYIPTRYPNGFPQGKPADFFLSLIHI